MIQILLVVTDSLFLDEYKLCQKTVVFVSVSQFESKFILLSAEGLALSLNPVIKQI